MSVAVAISDPFSIHMESAARKCMGEPNTRLSTKTELRFGAQGSLSVDLDKGTWFDHEAGKGGGVMDFLAREKGLKGQEAIAWLRQECGADFEDRSRSEAPLPKARIVATYDYIDEHGEVLFQVVRLEPKTFRQRKPDPGSFDGWSWGAKGVRQIPYRLPEVLEAVRRRDTVFIVEGEKDADALAREGLCATCNAMGAGKWPEGLSDAFTGADVVILPDNDDAGRAHAQAVASALAGAAKSVKVLELPELPPKGDVSDWLSMGGDAIELTIMASQAPIWGTEPPKSRFGAIRWADLDGVMIRQDFLVEDLMFCGDVGMIYGESGSGKSFLAVDMGLSIARGVPFLGKRTRQGAVLYQAGEGGKGLVKRLRAYRQHHHVAEDVPFILLPARVDLFSPDGNAEAFLAECQAWAAVLPLSAIIIDTLATASPGANENAVEDMSRLILAGEEISKSTGSALFWVHHKNASGLRERGHTSLRANIDTAIEVTKDNETNERTLRLSKMKDGEDGLKIGFDLQSVQIGSYDDGKPMTSCVVVPAQLGTERTSHRRPLPKGQQRYLKILDTAIIQYGGMVPAQDVYGVPYPAFRDLFTTACGQGMTDVAIRQTLSRDGNDLWMADLIGREGNFLWITEKGSQYL